MPCSCSSCVQHSRAWKPDTRRPYARHAAIRRRRVGWCNMDHQKDGGPSSGTGQLGARGKRCGSTDVILQKPIQLGPKSFVCQCFLESAVEFFKGWYQRLGNVASAEFPKSSGGIRLGWRELRHGVVYSRLFFPKMRRRKSRQRSLACAPCFPNPMCSFGAPV